MSFDLSVLGVKENIPKVAFTEYSGLLAGVPKIGKTTLASLYDNCILLACEIGYKAKKINVRDIKNWEDLKDFTSLLEENREEIGDDIQTIVIDTVDRLYPYAQDYVVKKYNRRKSPDLPRAENIGDIPHGKGWSDGDKEFLCEISKILNLGFTFLFLTHNKIKTIAPKNGIPYDVYYPTMPERCSAVIYPLVDFILNMQRTAVLEEGEMINKRELILRGNEMANGGSRVGDINARIIFDTEEEAIAKFKESFKKAIEKEIHKSDDSIDVSKLEAQQKVEKDVLVKENLKVSVELPNIIKEIKAVIKEKLKAKTINNNHILSVLSTFNVSSPDEIKDSDTANIMLEEFKKA